MPSECVVVLGVYQLDRLYRPCSIGTMERQTDLCGICHLMPFGRKYNFVFFKIYERIQKKTHRTPFDMYESPMFEITYFFLSWSMVCLCSLVTYCDSTYFSFIYLIVGCVNDLLSMMKDIDGKWLCVEHTNLLF